MRACPLDQHGLGLVGNDALEPILVPLDIEYNDVFWQEACRRVAVLDVLRRPPSGILHLENPALKPSSGGGVLLDKVVEYCSADQPHTRSPGVLVVLVLRSIT